MNRCNICIDPMCNGKEKCHCETCAIIEKCNRILRATIRITTKCTQSCSHCCFSCSPKKNDFMSISMAEKIHSFLVNNEINNINLMGGEFCMHPNWFEIFLILTKDIKYVRIVTNGDWLEEYCEQVKELSKQRVFVFAISKDKWHTNKNVKKAELFCKENNIFYKVSTEEQTKNESIVPVGNALFEYNFFSTFGCYCHNPEHKYSFLIDEEGEIYKCSFGVWNYSNIEDYIDGKFSKRFKEFNKVFYSTFISNCRSCIRSYRSSV